MSAIQDLIFAGIYIAGLLIGLFVGLQYRRSELKTYKELRDPPGLD